MQSGVVDFVRHAQRYVDRHASEMVTGAGGRSFLPLDVQGALLPASVPSRILSDPELCTFEARVRELSVQASVSHGALTFRLDNGLFTRGLRIFYVNGFHADSELRAKAPDEDYERAPPGTLRGPFVHSSARTSGRVLVGDYVTLESGEIVAPDEVNAVSDVVRQVSTFAQDPLSQMGSVFDWLPFMSESGIPKVFWLLNVNADSALCGAVAVLGMDHDDGKTSFHAPFASSRVEFIDVMQRYVDERRSVANDRACLTFGEYCFYSRSWSLFYPSIATPVISVECNTEAMDWCASGVLVDSLPSNVDPFHRGLIKCRSAINADMLAYEASIASTQARLAASSDAPELEDDDDMVRGGGGGGGASSSKVHAASDAAAPTEIVNSWVSESVVDTALRHDKLTSVAEPIKYDVRDIDDRDEQHSVFYSDVLTVLPRMIAAFDAFAATHETWSDVQVRERIIDMNSDFQRFAGGRFNLIQHLLKRERNEALLSMTLSVSEACAALQESFVRKTRDLDLTDPEEREEYSVARLEFEREVDREIQNGWARFGFDDAVWLNNEIVRDMK